MGRELGGLIFGLLLSVPVLAQGLAGAPIVLESGNWTVLRTTNLMTDEVVCTALHDRNYAIQLSETGLFVSVRGGVRMFQLRFDERPAEVEQYTVRAGYSKDFVTLKNMSKRNRMLDQALAATRLRMTVMTFLGTVEQFDLDLTGIKDAYASIEAGCPGEPQGTIEAPDPAG